MKKKHVVLATLAVLFCIAFANPCSAADEKTITAASNEWPPFVNNKDTENKGLSIEIIIAAYATQGYTVEMDIVPWARAMAHLKKGKIDIIPNTWMTEERKGFLKFSEPYAVNEIVFIKTEDDPFEFEGLESLTGKKIGTARGYGYGDLFMNATNFKREESKDLETNLKKLTHPKKRVDLTLADKIVAQYLVTTTAPGLADKIAYTESALSSNPLYITSGLANPRYKEIIAAFNKGLAEIKANGTYAKILASYGIQ